MWCGCVVGSLLEVYLDVIVVFAREPHGQLAFGLGTAIPQPSHFRRELQVLDGEGGGRRGEARRGTAGEGGGRHHVKPQEEGNVEGGRGNRKKKKETEAK